MGSESLLTLLSPGVDGGLQTSLRPFCPSRTPGLGPDTGLFFSHTKKSTNLGLKSRTQKSGGIRKGLTAPFP